MKRGQAEASLKKNLQEEKTKKEKPAKKEEAKKWMKWAFLKKPQGKIKNEWNSYKKTWIKMGNS